jgi:hypothetical protein
MQNKPQFYLPMGRFFDSLISYLNSSYRLKYFPNIWNPKKMNEILLSEKIFNYNFYSKQGRVTDKEDIQDWILELGLGQYLNETVIVVNEPNELLGKKFDMDVIIKPTHSSGYIKIIPKDQILNSSDIKEMSDWLLEDYYIRSREPNYKGLKRKIIVEKMLYNVNKEPVRDYKYFCSSGRVKAIQLDLGRFKNHTRQLYTKDWKLLNISMGYPHDERQIETPECLSEMISISEKISENIKYCRVDLYVQNNNKIFFGELTFFPGNCAERFSPPEGDRLMGNLLLNQ